MNQEKKEREIELYLILSLLVAAVMAILFWVLRESRIEPEMMRVDILSCEIDDGQIAKGDSVPNKTDKYHSAQRAKLAKQNPQGPNMREALRVNVGCILGGLCLSDRNSLATDPLPADSNRREELTVVLDQRQGSEREAAHPNGMLEYILDIHYPEHVELKSHHKRRNRFSASFPVSAIPNHRISTTCRERDTARLFLTSKFYRLSDELEPTADDHAARAVIYQGQTLIDGPMVKLRQQDAIKVEDTKIPKDSFVFGLVRMQDERLEIKVETIRFPNQFLSVVDIDGLSGTPISGATTYDATQQSVDRTVEAIRLAVLDVFWAGQVARAGVKAAQHVTGKAMRPTKVDVKVGYLILFRDDEKQQKEMIWSRSDRLGVL